MHCPHCGCEQPKPGKSRSIDQHRRFFALIAAAYDNWPEHHSEQFASAEECRKWLTMKAGHREIGATIPLAGVRKDRAMLLAEAAIRAAGAYARAVIHGDNLVIWKPKSIAFDQLSHMAFCQLQKEVEDVIEAELGVSPDSILPARTQPPRKAIDAAVKETTA